MRHVNNATLHERRKKYQDMLEISTAEFNDKIDALSLEFLNDIREVEEDDNAFNDFLDVCMYWLLMFLAAFIAIVAFFALFLGA
jgi:hypothetical protein